MTTASIHSTDTPAAEVIHDFVAALDKDAISLGKDDASRCVRADVKALRAAIEGVAGTVASTLLAVPAELLSMAACARRSVPCAFPIAAWLGVIVT